MGTSSEHITNLKQSILETYIYDYNPRYRCEPDRKFVSISELRAVAAKTLETRRNHRLLQKFGAKSLESLQVVEAILDDVILKSVLAVEAPSQQQPGANVIKHYHGNFNPSNSRVTILR
jgi:hypothetical protein